MEMESKLFLFCMLPLQQAITSKPDPNNLSSSKDMVSNRLLRHQLLPSLVSLSNCLLSHHSSTRRAPIRHKHTLPRPLSRLIIPCPLLHSLEWLPANLGLISQDQVLHHLLEVPSLLLQAGLTPMLVTGLPLGRATHNLDLVIDRELH